DEGVVELVDVLYHTNNIVEAEKWIAFADREGISTPRLHFLKGMVLAKRGRLDEAVLAFETAKNSTPD
ncbi:MAG TPA: tetratricopeptide repeat protein, partial [Syntrophorhabdaceae bacterium]|nr:tetratricopeptide repeat protein [Syntrophorhabdaceae bacterium]